MATMMQVYVADARARKKHLDELSAELSYLSRRRDVLLETIEHARDNLHMVERKVLNTLYRED